MRIMIIRHAEPNYEKDRLTPRGEREAQLLADRLEKEKIDAFFVSPYGRARLTAKPTLERFGEKEVLCDFLHEFDYPIIRDDGTPKHIPWDILPAQWTVHPENFDKDRWFETEAMRSGNIKGYYDSVIRDFDGLIAKFGYERDGLLYKAVRPNTDTIALFCHFGLESVLLSHLLNISPMVLWHMTVALPTGVTILNTEEREEGTAIFRMAVFGDVSHLTMNGVEPSFKARFCETYDNWDQVH